MQHVAKKDLIILQDEEALITEAEAIIKDHGNIEPFLFKLHSRDVIERNRVLDKVLDLIDEHSILRELGIVTTKREVKHD